jgi:hypothetical protein
MAIFNQSPLAQTSLALQEFSLTAGTDASTATVVPIADKRTTYYVKPDWRRNASLLR